MIKCCILFEIYCGIQIYVPNVILAMLVKPTYTIQKKVKEDLNKDTK